MLYNKSCKLDRCLVFNDVVCVLCVQKLALFRSPVIVPIGQMEEGDGNVYDHTGTAPTPESNQNKTMHKACG